MKQVEIVICPNCNGTGKQSKEKNAKCKNCQGAGLTLSDR